MKSLRTSDILVEIIAACEGIDGEYRTISDKVLWGEINLPSTILEKRTAWLAALGKKQWQPSAIVNVPDDCANSHPVCPEAEDLVLDWMQAQGFPNLRDRGSFAAVGCRAAAYHHDLGGFGESLFCVVWTEEDQGLDLVFPNLALRIPLKFGTVVAFDAGQPHGVVRKSLKNYDARSYTNLPMQTFISIDFGAAVPGVADVMGIQLRDTATGWPGYVDYAAGAGFSVQRHTGKWIAPKNRAEQSAP